ncbi:MAG: hypothetical protein F6J92_28975 [Symploca sp. SIO1A3]|nr:hypothetical protein [Symploca sp. SIO1A3]
MSEHTRKTVYAIVPVEKLRGIHTKTDEEVIAAQKSLDRGTIAALEEMINAAKARNLEGDAILSLQAAKW